MRGEDALYGIAAGVLPLLASAGLPMLPTRRSRYYAAHAMLNAWVVWNAWTATLRTLAYGQSPWMHCVHARRLACGIGVFHGVHLGMHVQQKGVQNMVADVVLHHAFTMWGSSLIWCNQLSYALFTVGVFFGCGAPGLVDYAMLTAVEARLMRRTTERLINAVLHAFVRGPGLLYFVSAVLLVPPPDHLMTATARSMLLGGLWFNAAFYQMAVCIAAGRHTR